MVMAAVVEASPKVTVNSPRQRLFRYPLLASVIVVAMVVSIWTEVRKSGKLTQTVTIPDHMSGNSVPIPEIQRTTRIASAVVKEPLPTEAGAFKSDRPNDPAQVQLVPQENTSSTAGEHKKMAVKKGKKKKNSKGNRKGKESESASEQKPLNILILYGDDWRHDSIGSANASIVRTPFFDWLAEVGVKFVHNCVTTSVCWISRATLYTGLYVSRHKSNYPHEPRWYSGWNDAWPQILKEKGYHLGHVGKWHFPVEALVKDTFHYLDAYYGQHWYMERRTRIHSTKKDEEGALKFLRGRPKDKPFLLEVCFFAPHSVDGTDEQYFPQEESMSLYENETVAVPISATPGAWNKLPKFFGNGNEGRRRWRIRFNTPEKHQRMMKNYFRLISEIDKTSEVIYKELEAQNLVENTMIIFTTDNGLFHSEHQLAGKWYPHQESIRVPLIIKDPRMPKDKIGTINDDFTLNIDLASTILGAAGVKQPSVMQGRDISDLYLRSEPKWREEFFYEHPVHLDTRIIPASTALVRKKYKFMTWPDYNVEQLFDLDADPLELQDLIDSSELKGVISEMRKRHSLLKRAALEPGPIDETPARLLRQFQNESTHFKWSTLWG
jgi:arylsulfatase